ncbi:scaffold protein Scd2 [Mytilinidion resinicola]|uniref:Scaffold protein Scd2 n=1 Tax=Mytilinidion resinicola TaxID=574789 RepID=A0A6A6YC23_9PEZI|nr:scaffold protein Scd2 [Mytilinidion resinicola]KAF2805645.1 scaffold protein Scd2 [Mytilinidion resinicola]
MVKFRRSMKGDKADSKPHHISIPPKDAIAIVPPKKVIKALYDYTPPDSSPSSGYLSFSQGDFLHVVGRENDPDWYEACNPLQNTRGLVPVTYFELVGKTVRDSGSSTKSIPSSQPSAGHDSGYAEKTPAASGAAIAENDGPKPMRMSKALGKGAGVGAMVYGIVMYDFKAERPDELEAKEGEAIIVIAQSNPEWFVAKPITRLGGPGLIPVSFIEIRDMTTGQAVPDAQEAVQRAGVPKVEEWKKMAADYKNGSIPLGKLESNSAQSLQQGMERMSLGSKNQAGYDSNGQVTPGTGSHSRSASAYQNQPQYRGSDPNLLAPVKACVPRYCFADDIFWFIIECQMEDGRHWELQRLYQDFYDLQIQLIAAFPVEAGTAGTGDRTLPFMPGPVTYVTDNISNGRRANLDEYIKNLLKLGSHITQGTLVKTFFAPRQGDYEIDPDVIAAEEYRMSQSSQHSSDPSQGASRESSADHLPSQNSQAAYPNSSNYPSQANHQRGQASMSGQQLQNPQHYRTTSDLAPPMLRQTSSLTQNSATSASAALKIKVWFEEDNCVVIRMPQSFRYNDLYKKLQERRALERPDEGRSEELVVEYRDEREERFYPIENDEDLAIAVERNPKLTLSVTAMR